MPFLEPTMTAMCNVSCLSAGGPAAAPVMWAQLVHHCPRSEPHTLSQSYSVHCVLLFLQVGQEPQQNMPVQLVPFPAPS